MYRGSVAYQSYFGFKLATGLQFSLTLTAFSLFILISVAYTSNENGYYKGKEFIFILISTLMSFVLLVLSSKMISKKNTTILLVHQIYVISYIVFLLTIRMVTYFYADGFEPLYLIMFTYVLLSTALLSLALFQTLCMHDHFLDAQRDRTRESAVAHRNTYPSFDASGPEPVLKSFRKSPNVIEDQQNSRNAAYTSEPVLKSFRRKSSDVLEDQKKRPPAAPKLTVDRKRSHSMEDYLDFDSPKPPNKPQRNTLKKRSGSFDDVLAELKKRQTTLQKY